MLVRQIRAKTTENLLHSVSRFMEHLAGYRLITMVVNQLAHQVVEYGTFDTGPFHGHIRGKNTASAINELSLYIVEHMSLLCCSASWSWRA